MKVKVLKFMKNHGFRGIRHFVTEEGQFHGKCHGREIMN